MNAVTLLSIFAQLRAFHRHDHWSHAELLAYQTERLRSLRAYAYAHSPFYQQFHHGLEHAPLQDLPVLTKSHLMREFDNLVTDRTLHLDGIRAHLASGSGIVPYQQRYRVVSTSGSSGHPGIFLFDQHEWSTVLASFARAREWAGQPARLTQRVKTAVVSSRDPRNMSTLAGLTLQSWLVPTLRLAATDPLDQTVKQLNAWQPQTLIAYASMMGVLAEEQEAGRLQIVPQLVLASSEVLTEETRRRLEAVWGDVVFNEYAATETGSLAAECQQHCGLHLFEDLVLVEVVDHDNQPVLPGTYGEKLLVTVLFNRTQPLIRYELTDSVRIAADPCPCGMPYQRLDGLQGRVEDQLQVPAIMGGMVMIHPNIFHQVMDTQAVYQWQIIQDADQIRVLVRPDPIRFNAQELVDVLRQALTQQGAAAIPLSIESVATIAKASSGKTPLIRAWH